MINVVHCLIRKLYYLTNVGPLAGLGHSMCTQFQYLKSLSGAQERFSVVSKLYNVRCRIERYEHRQYEQRERAWDA